MSAPDHPFIRPGQVAPDRPARDACMRCGQPEASHPDRRLIAAREYLDAIRPYKVSDRPHSVLVREAAGLRRMLGQLLDVIGQSRVVLGQALADAIAYRQPGLWCTDCRVSPSELCEDHAADLDKSDSYRALGAGLGIEVER